jgi:hypothetical protein
LYWGCQEIPNPVSQSGGQKIDGLAKTLPVGVVVTSAYLYLDVIDQSTDNVYVHRITTAWDESTVTWNFPWTTPGGDFAATPNETFTANAAEVMVDITTFVQSWLNGTSMNYGLLLRQDGSDWSRFYSSNIFDQTLRPRIVINYSVNNTNGSAEIIGGVDGEIVYDTYIWEIEPDVNNSTGSFANSLYTGLFSGGEKHTLIKFNIEGTPEPNESDCETAFAFGDDAATCFIDLGFRNWGWSNGPFGPGEYEFDVYAGAGQCDPSKGTHVGTVTLSYNGLEAVVMYNITEGYLLDDIHLYVGNDPLPKNKKGKNTVAPGLYPYGDPGTLTYTIPIQGDIYIVAHGVVCGNF